MTENVTENVIVCGVDGSENSRRAASWAADWATATGRTLRLVAGGLVQPVGGDPERMRADLDARLAAESAAIAETHPDLTVETVAEVGSPVTALLKESKTADAVVIGTKGTGGWKGLQAGSVSGAVSAQGYSPAVVVPLQADATFSRDGALVLGYDGLKGLFAFVELAFAAAEREGRPLKVVRSIEDAALAEESRAEIEKDLADLVAKHPGVELTIVVEALDPVELMAREAEGAAMAIVESRGYGGIGGFLLGPTATQLIQRSPAPVMVLTSRSERAWPVGG